MIFKDDDVGKDLPSLKKWTDIVLKADAKGCIGLIGKYLKDKSIIDFLNSLDKEKIEVFCHGYSHSHIPFLLRKVIGRNRILPTEFDRNYKSHCRSLKKYRELENRFLKSKAMVFGPPGNLWNNSLIDPLIKYNFNAMFSWWEIKGDILKIPLVDNYRQTCLEEYINLYNNSKDKQIYTLQFHHADLSEKQFELLPEVINFLKKEKRVFITPSELLNINL